MITWRKSSHSGGGGSGGQECVEVAQLPHAIGIRDSKNPGGPRHVVRPGAFRSLINEIKDGRLR